ncbi:MAG: NAD(P)H-dependent oxidoreductase, partial [Candidatus Verstraetearchaeota archaeon]|nr:NAD(P)H-dependent oxidoreductase [Candidatus Verstraetearchaeota archaeon]
MRCMCPQDTFDGMDLLKERALEADFLILGSPVYEVNFSAQMKTFLDRIPAWINTMRLAGMPGMKIATKAGNGMEEVQNYLGMMLVSMGSSVLEAGRLLTTLGSLGTNSFRTKRHWQLRKLFIRMWLQRNQQYLAGIP